MRGKCLGVQRALPALCRVVLDRVVVTQAPVGGAALALALFAGDRALERGRHCCLVHFEEVCSPPRIASVRRVCIARKSIAAAAVAIRVALPLATAAATAIAERGWPGSQFDAERCA